MLMMVARLILNDSNTFTTPALLTTVLGYHVQLSNPILNTITNTRIVETVLQIYSVISAALRRC